ncbi:hypothetical protein OPT61_g5899 [Boeremia exigua]|uniref:Uncharacterized protein n=1 Tax=Boeremia exigua TaxID=749465 RepID=A0ACC2I8M0_9PLEO|nr:hypothetical protein OPT61_g5899 [Boeremia exigua]
MSKYKGIAKLSENTTTARHLPEPLKRRTQSGAVEVCYTWPPPDDTRMSEKCLDQAPGLKRYCTIGAYAAHTLHGGGHVPDGSAFVQINSHPSHQPAFSAGSAPSFPNPAHGGAFNPNSPFAPNPVFTQPQVIATPSPVYEPHSIYPAQTMAQASIEEVAGHEKPYVPYVPIQLKGAKHWFDPYTSWKWESPRAYRKPGLGYQKLAKYRHLDVFEREWVGDYDDRYISSWDGKASKLVVQSTDEIYDNDITSTYRRTYIRNVAPRFLRLANWPYSHVDPNLNDGKPTSQDMPMLYAKWFLTSLMISFVISSPSPASLPPRNGGNYDPVPYRYYGYPKVARNATELDVPRGSSSLNPITERVLRPRYLCFLREPGQPAMIMNVEEWLAQHGSERNLSYIFVAYTAEQFQTSEDLMVLHQIADAAARHAGVTAYWVGCSCMPEADQLQEDVYRICDVIRGAQSLVIAVGQPPNNKHTINTTDLMLQQWGNRIWTFPEILLAPAGKDIKVYLRNSDFTQPLRIPKNQFAAKVWKDDAHIARQLIDHYEGNLLLSQLELVTLALECLHKRRTYQYLPGDHSYALMGLVRIRPRIDPTDTAFQAFARLSMANGSDQLLERLICVLPKRPDQPWHSMDDAYGAKLWEILPEGVEISGIGHDDTVILDGCRAANVRWKSFTPVANTRRQSWGRWIAEKLLRISGLTYLVGIFLVAIPNTTGLPGLSPTQGAGVFLIIWSIFLAFLSPWLLRVLYLGKFWDQQCWLFGFEGYMPIETIESQIFGARLCRLRWTPYASPLSRHHKNNHNECVADDPTTDPDIKALVERCKHAGPGDQRLFTLVDTGNMTVTLFTAARPPTCFLMAGSEGGMKRIVGCSYDWTTSTMYRETVLRMETRFEDKMSRIGRVKVGFRRAQHPVAPLTQVGEAAGSRVE